MEIINKDSFDTKIKDGVVLVDFFATWCGPCKMLSPVLEELTNDYATKATIVKVDVDQDPELAMRYGVMSVPTMVIFKNGEVVKQLQGFLPKQEIGKAIDANL